MISSTYCWVLDFFLQPDVQFVECCICCIRDQKLHLPEDVGWIGNMDQMERIGEESADVSSSHILRGNFTTVATKKANIWQNDKKYIFASILKTRQGCFIECPTKTCFLGIKKTPTHYASIWGLVWRNPKGFLISISFRGCTFTSPFRFDLFYFVDFHSALTLAFKKPCFGGTL